MTKFILIFVIISIVRSTTSVTSVEFDNLEACDHAGSLVSAQLAAYRRDRFDVIYSCVPKSLEEPE